MRASPLTDPLSIMWIAWCEAEHKPATTIARRIVTLRSVGNAGVATREDIDAWWATRRDLSPATRTADLANLRSFYKWCWRWDHLPPADDPTTHCDAPKVPNRLPRPISRADMLHLLGTFPDDLRRAVALGGYGGLRVGEAALLDWADVDTEARRARILGKDQFSRLVALSPMLIDHLLPNTGGNVVSAGGKPYTAATLQRRVNRAIVAAGVDATFHQLRHRYGTIAYQATGDLLGVGRQMGHRAISSTAIYAAASDDVGDRIADAVAR